MSKRIPWAYYKKIFGDEINSQMKDSSPLTFEQKKILFLRNDNRLNIKNEYIKSVIESVCGYPNRTSIVSTLNEIYYHLLKGEKAPVLHWMNHIAPDEQEHFLTIQYYQYLIRAKVYIWLGQYVRGRMILQLLLEYAKDYKSGIINKGLFLHGNFGCGKTYLVAALFNELAMTTDFSLIILLK